VPRRAGASAEVVIGTQVGTDHESLFGSQVRQPHRSCKPVVGEGLRKSPAPAAL